MGSEVEMSIQTPADILDHIIATKKLALGQHLELSDAMDVVRMSIELLERFVNKPGGEKKGYVLQVVAMLLETFHVSKDTTRVLSTALPVFIDVMVYAYNSELFRSLEQRCGCKWWRAMGICNRVN